LYAVALIMLIGVSRKDAVLAQQVKTSEASLAQIASRRGADAASLSSSLTNAQQRLATLLQRIPSDLQPTLFEGVAQDAQRSGITDFRYQRKSESIDNLPSGTYKVFHLSIQGKGSQDKLITFLDDLQKNAAPTVVVDNIILTAAGKEWQMTGDMSVYTSATVGG
jgi:hypothetical protein